MTFLMPYIIRIYECIITCYGGILKVRIKYESVAKNNYNNVYNTLWMHYQSYKNIHRSLNVWSSHKVF